MSREDRIARRAPRPPMGWNSWDSFGTQVTEAEVRAHADAMAARLAPFGWQYVVVDIQWYEPRGRTWADGAQPEGKSYEELWASSASGFRADEPPVLDAHGRLHPDPVRFPSSSDGSGFRALADYVHARGLQFGIHIMRGVPRVAANRALPILGSEATCADIADRDNVCQWNADNYGIDMSKPGAREYYASLIELYASWGVDFIKADNLLDVRGGAGDVEALADGIDRCGREIVLSLSPGALDADCVRLLHSSANMMRATGDLWDFWSHEGYPTGIYQAFEAAAAWVPLARQGHWPDLDMLPLGALAKNDSHAPERMTRLTPDEQYTLMSLWCVARSPLMFGGDLMMLDPFTESLLTNPEVLAVQQASRGNREVARDAASAVWTAVPEVGAGVYVALFNRSDAPLAVGVDLGAVGCGPSVTVRDLWARADVGSATGRLERELPPHASGLYLLT